MRAGEHIVVYVEGKEPPYAFHGRFNSEDEEYITILGTVGNLMGKLVTSPQAAYCIRRSRRVNLSGRQRSNAAFEVVVQVRDRVSRH